MSLALNDTTNSRLHHSGNFLQLPVVLVHVVKKGAGENAICLEYNIRVVTHKNVFELLMPFDEVDRQDFVCLFFF